MAFWWSSLGLVTHAEGEGKWQRVRSLLNGYRDVLHRRNPLIEDAL